MKQVLSSQSVPHQARKNNTHWHHNQYDCAFGKDGKIWDYSALGDSLK